MHSFSNFGQRSCPVLAGHNLWHLFTSYVTLFIHTILYYAYYCITIPARSANTITTIVFCDKYNKYMFDFIDINSFISVSGYIDLNPSAWLFLGAYYAVKTALLSAPPPRFKLNARSNNSLKYILPQHIKKSQLLEIKIIKWKCLYTKITPTDYAIVLKNKLQKNLYPPTLMTQHF